MGVGLGALVLFAALGAAVMVLAVRPENKLGLRGGLKIEADPGVDVYIGNKYVGTGSVELTWDELLGTPALQPLATAIFSVVPSPSTDGMGAITAEAIGGQGSQIIWKQSGMTSITPLPIACKQILLRRQNGDLDLISVIEGEFATHTASRNRFLVPIRLRAANDESSEFVCGQAESWKFGPNNKSIDGIVHSRPTPPPDEFADEIATKGLWIPQK
ncbi:MAG: hypothetical protein AB7Q45_07115 [Planctomycetaceae bacterium]